VFKKSTKEEEKKDYSLYLPQPIPPLSQSRSSTQISDKATTPIKDPPQTPSPARGLTDSSESDHEKSDKSSPRSGIAKSREWLSDERNKRRDPFPPLSTQILNHHLTIGPHGGIDWVKRFGLDTASRKTNSSQMGIDKQNHSPSSETSEETASIRHSTDCIVAAKELAASSDSDLLRSAPPWMQPRSKFRFSPEKDGQKPGGPAEAQAAVEVRRPSAPASTLEKVGSAEEPLRPRSGTGDKPRASLDPAAILSVQSASSYKQTAPPQKSPAEPVAPSTSEAPLSAAEELAAKKSRVKSSLLKRARSVAIFSLKLKERRAKDALKQEAKALSPPKPASQSQQWTGRNPDRVEGELSCIPIEKLISVDDVANELMRKRTNT